VETSSDGGQSWGTLARFAGDHPSIAVDSSGRIHISYQYCGEVYYTQSQSNGEAFSEPLLLGAGCSPDIAVDASGSPYVVWQQDCGSGYEYTNIVLARPVPRNSGSVALMSKIVAATSVGETTTSYSEPPKVAVSPSGSNVYVIWKCPSRYGAYVRTYFTRSLDGGDTFEPRYNPTDFVRYGEYSPDVAAYGERVVYIAWVLDGYRDDGVRFDRSRDSGAESSFSHRVKLTRATGNRDTTIAADSLGQVCVAWREGVESSADLYYRCSLDQGDSFQPQRVLASGPPDTEQKNPALALWHDANRTYLDAAWEDGRYDRPYILFGRILIGP
jgi:hypothetical protein